MIADLKPKAMRSWAADKPIEIRGAVSNYLGSLRLSKKSPNDARVKERLGINRAVLLAEVDKIAQPSEERVKP